MSNSRAKTYKEFVELCEKFSLAKDTSKPQSPKPTKLPRSREVNIGTHDDWKDKPSTEWGERPTAGKKLKSRASAVVGTQKRQDVETGVREEYELDEVKGFGGHIDPQTGKPTGKRSTSQQAHAQHWSNRSRGIEAPDPRRSKFKYGGASKSTTGSHEGDTPEGFAKKQDPGLAMTPSARMKARARSLELKGKGKQANKIRAVANRPNMSEIDEGIGMTMASALGNPPPLSKRMKLKQALIINKIKSDARKNKEKKYSGKAASQS